MKKVSVNWKMQENITDVNSAVTRYRVYLENKGLKNNTVILYTRLARVYLEELKTDQPSSQDAFEYHNALHQKKLSKTAMNNFAAAITKYQEMIKKPVKLPFLKTTKRLPYFFDETDITKLFSACKNIKHLCMLKVLFYGCLRPGELCNLDVEDYDPKNLTLRLRETKNGTDALSFINDETAKLLNQYLKVRPPLEIDGHEPLFYTDYGHRWTNGDIHRMFASYKKSAGIGKRGGPHVFARHSSATLMVAKGCDLRTVQSILRHRDINTTLRYTHLTDKTKREKYEQYMKL